MPVHHFENDPAANIVTAK